MKLHRKSEPALVVVFTVVMVLANALPNTLRLRGETTGSISAKYPTLFEPAEYAFAIWAVIYLALIGFALVQLLPSAQRDPVVQRIRRPYMVSCLLNSLWILAWHYELLTLSVVLMAGLLASLLLCYRRLDQGRENTLMFRALVVSPFSLYAAWIAVATMANVAAALHGLGWQGGPLVPSAWSALLIIAAGGVTLLTAWPRRDWIFAAVTAWAVIAVAAKQAGTPLVVWTGVLVGVAMLALAAALLYFRLRGRRRW